MVKTADLVLNYAVTGYSVLMLCLGSQWLYIVTNQPSNYNSQNTTIAKSLEI